MPRILLALLICLSSSLYAIGGFTRAISPSYIELSSKPPILMSDYSVTELLLIEDTSTRLMAAPFLIWMEAGLAVYEQIANAMITNQLNTLKKMKAAEIILKVADGKSITKEDIDFLMASYSMDFDKFPYAPFVYNFGDGYALTKQAAGRVQERHKVAKVDILSSDGMNAFMLFPIEKPYLQINDIVMPPLVFVEYGGLLCAYTIDLSNGRMKFFDPKRIGGDRDFTCKANSSEPCGFLAYKVPSILQKNKALFLRAYAKFLQGGYDGK